MFIDRLCFGTSTFVAGRLRPDKDSGPGIEALAEAVDHGLTKIHSNPKLGTQWAIHRALSMLGGAPTVQHLIKAEAPLDADRDLWQAAVSSALQTSREELHVDRLHALVWEIDLKRTADRRVLVDHAAVRSFYVRGAEIALESGLVDEVIAYCHSPAHLSAALDGGHLSGFAAQYNVAEPWPALYLDHIDALGRSFIGMAPLRRGDLVGVPLDPADSIVGGDGSLTAVRWALADPRVNAVTITMSTAAHLRQVMHAASRPLASHVVETAAGRWLSAARQDQGRTQTGSGGT